MKARRVRGLLFAICLAVTLAGCMPVQPAPPATPDVGNCPVTIPNRSRPPEEIAHAAGYHGNGKLWVAIWPDGVTRVHDPDVASDGWLGMKFPWWRGVEGPLEITGRRLDGSAPAARAVISEGYGSKGFQSTAVYFPTEGCWEITGRVGDATLTFVTLVKRTNEEYQWPSSD